MFKRLFIYLCLIVLTIAAVAWLFTGSSTVVLPPEAGIQQPWPTHTTSELRPTNIPSSSNCLWGNPVLQSEASLEQKIIERTDYTTDYSAVAKEPLWVCEHLTASRLEGDLKRTSNPFAEDPLTENMEHPKLSDYTDSGFDKGHMAPASDEATNEELWKQSFFLSNIVPQVGVGFNRSIWKHLETEVKKWTKERGETWVVTGPMYLDEHLEGYDDPAAFEKMRKIGDGQVIVPTHLYKIVATAVQDRTQMIAFVLSNTKHPKTEDLSSDIVSIKWIEEHTGLEFYPDAPANLTADIGRLKQETSDLWN